MQNAGSALMGIGRASGENRAIQAAQQAVESPLLEVSIDGARGILFNVIGGMDMSMHEINTAAETITAAADPDANIIFGATINPELEGEMIITVVATGFDAAYFANRREPTAPQPISTAGVAPQQPADESVLKDMDMDLHDDEDEEEEFHTDKPLPNIWTIDNGNNHDEEKPENDEPKPSAAPSFANDDEDELEKPSFLRRLKKKRQEDKKPESDASTEDENQ
jgi:cell division protein FtsZ